MSRENNNVGERRIGSVKWFDDQKGFGFITPADGSDDLFVHQSSIISEGFRSLVDGEYVKLEVEIDNNGRPKAIEVFGLNGALIVLGNRRSLSGGRRGYDGGGKYSGGGGGGGS